MAIDLKRVQAVFLAAAEATSAAARAALLDRECGDDAELRQQVETLLKAHDAPGSFLDRPALGSSPTENELPPPDDAATQAPSTEAVGTVIGNYKLLEQIGEGGFGTVFMAEQHQPVRRKVALKVIKPGMDTRQVIARFDVERQALAMMDHPNIAKVFDGGETASGRPYFVMELVKGVPITDYCDQTHLSPRERLELFGTVCQAVQHAHQKGIIHRDLKPSNVLVTVHDGRPLVKIIDFGIAKATGGQLTDKTLFTGFAQMIGTPLYMSPEQAGQSLDIDTRSDIYSLGVLLYELLTGTTPFDRERFKKAAYDEIRRIICEEDPPKPSTRLSESNGSLPSISAQRHTEPAKLTKLVRGELDWIVMKALEKDRNRRYETANGFAMDIQRYLTDEPVQACPPSAGYRLRKFARRNKRALAMMSCLALVLLAASILSTWQAVRASRAEQKALVNFDRASDAVKRMLTRVAQEKLVGVPWMEPVRKALLEDALEFYEQLLAERTDDPEIRLATAQAQITLNWINWRFGATGKLESSYGRALGLLEGLVAEFPEDLRYRAALANALHHYSHRTTWDKKRWRECVQTMRRAIELQESVVAAKSDSADDAYDLTNMLDLFGNALRTGSRPQEAEDAYQRGFAISERILAKEPNHASHLCGQVSGLTHIAELYVRKDPAKAEAVLECAQAIAARLKAADQKHGFLFDRSAAALSNLERQIGALHGVKGRVAEMQAAYRRALALLQKHADSYPSDRIVRAGLALSYFDLARSLTDPEDQDEAAEAFEQAVKIREKIDADYPGEIALANGSQLWRCHHYYAAWLNEAQRPDEAETSYRRALAVAVKLLDHFGDDSDYPGDAAHTAESLGRLLEENERLEEAEGLYRQALGWAQVNSSAHPAGANRSAQVARLHRRLAALLRDSGRPEEAVKHCHTLVAEFPKELEYRRLLAQAHADVARAAEQAKRPADAEAAFRNAVTVTETAAADFPKDAEAWQLLGYRARSLATFLMTQKRPTDAQQAWATAIRAFDTAGAMPDPVAANARFWGAATRRQLAVSALAQNRPKEAEELLQKALDTTCALPGTFLQIDNRHRGVTDCVNGYASFLRAQNRPQEATAVMQRGIDFYAALHASMPNDKIFRDELLDQCRKLAWFLATAANPKNRDAKRAVELAKKAVELAPEHGLCWNTLGVALYCAQEGKDSLAALQKSMELREGGDSLDWFFVAAAHAKLGHEQEARKWFDQAVEWMESNQPNNDELRRFRDEATKLLKGQKE